MALGIGRAQWGESSIRLRGGSHPLDAASGESPPFVVSVVSATQVDDKFVRVGRDV